MTSPIIENPPNSDELKCAREVLKQLTSSDQAVIPHYERLSALIKYLDELKDHPNLKELEKPALAALITTVPLCDPNEWENCYIRLVKRLIYGLVWASDIPNYTEVLWNVYLQHSYTCAKSLRDISLVSSNPQLRLAGVTELGKWVQALDGHIPFNELLSTAVHLLNDIGKDTRESAYALLVFYFARKSTGTQAYLFDEMNKQKMTPNTIDRIKISIEREKAAISRKQHRKPSPISIHQQPVPVSSQPSGLARSDSLSSLEAAKSRTPSPFPSHRSPESPATSISDPSPKDQLGSNEYRQPAKNGIQSGGPENGFCIPAAHDSKSRDTPLTADFGPSDSAEEYAEEWRLVVNDPNYPLIPLHDDYDMTDEDFLKFVEGIVPLFEGKETEDNWDKRWQATSDYRRVIRSHYQELSPQAVHQGIRMLRRGFNEAVLTLRTKLTIEICNAIKESVQVFQGNSVGFHDLFDLFLNSLSKVATGTRKITNPPANLALCVMLMRSSSISRSQFTSISSDCRSIRQPTRLAGYFWLRLILTDSLIPSFRSFEADVVGITSSAVGDASPEGRASGRTLLSKLEKVWPSAYNKVLPKLSAANLRLIQQKDPVSKPPNRLVDKASIANPKLRTQRTAATLKPSNPAVAKPSARPQPGRLGAKVASPLMSHSIPTGRCASAGSVSTNSQPSQLPSRSSSVSSRISFPAESLHVPIEPEQVSVSLSNIAPPNGTSSPIREPSADNLSRHFEDLSINNMEIDGEIADSNGTDWPASVTTNANQEFSPEAALVTNSAQENDEHVDMADRTAIIAASQTKLDSLLRSIAISPAVSSQKYAWFDLILHHSDCDSADKLLSCIQRVFQRCTIMRESNSLMELQMLAKNYKPSKLSPSSPVATEHLPPPQSTDGKDSSMMDVEKEPGILNVLSNDTLEQAAMGQFPAASNSSSDSPSPLQIYRDSIQDSADPGQQNGTDSQGCLRPQLFPVIRDVCERFISGLLNSVKTGDATASGLVTLTVLLHAVATNNSIDSQSRHVLQLPVSIWQQHSSAWGALLSRHLLMFLSGHKRTENETLAGLVLLRVLLTFENVLAAEAVQLCEYVSTLQSVAGRFQFNNARISHVLTTICDLMVTSLASAVETSHASIDFVFQGDVYMGLYLATQLARQSSNFITRNEPKLIELCTKGLHDPDIRTRARLFPLTRIIHAQNRPTYDLFVTPLSEDERALVAELLLIDS